MLQVAFQSTTQEFHRQKNVHVLEPAGTAMSLVG
jgi:hypothetical protein